MLTGNRLLVALGAAVSAAALGLEAQAQAVKTYVAAGVDRLPRTSIASRAEGDTTRGRVAGSVLNAAP